MYSELLSRSLPRFMNARYSGQKIITPTLPHPILSSALGKRLNELLPSIEKRRISIGKGRKNAYLFTSLDEARDEFVQVNRLTSIRWVEDEDLRLLQVS